MPRPSKYATPKEAAENYLYTKMGGPTLGLRLGEFIHLVTHKCDLCGCPPKEAHTVDRTDGKYLLWHQWLSRDNEDRLRPLCRTCRTLLGLHDLKELLSHCARIMARRKWGVTNRWFFQAQEK